MTVLACIQYRPPRLATCRADVMDNIRRAKELMVRAARLRPSLVVLPELCFTGFSFLSEDEAAAVAEPSSGSTFGVMRRFAVAARTHVAYGLLEDAGGSLHNSAVLMSPRGDVLTVTRKQNLVGCDDLWATAGTAPPEVVETPVGRMAAIVCKDVRNRGEDGETFVRGSVDIAAMLTNWGTGFFPPSAWKRFAEDVGCHLAVANRWGEEVNESPVHGTMRNNFGQGGSAVIRPDGRPLIGGLRFSDDCVVAAEVETT